MIKNHPKFPTSSIEQYQLMSKLPEYLVHNKQSDIQIKDHNYYHDNFNIWNNRFQANKKNFAAFHAINVKAQPAIEKRKQQEIDDRIQVEVRRREYSSEVYKILFDYNELGRLQRRKNERTALQSVCQQPLQSQQYIEVMDQQYLHKNVNQSNLAINGRADYLWNKMNKLSKKQIQQQINQRIIQMDEAAVISIQQKLLKDQECEDIKHELQQENVKQIRQVFRKQHDKNYEFEKKVGLVPFQKPLVVIKENVLRGSQSSQSKFRRSQHNQASSSSNIQIDNVDKFPTVNTNNIYYQNQSNDGTSMRTYEHYPQKYVDIQRFVEAQSTKGHSRTDSLAQPKREAKSYLLAKNSLDRTEFKGLLVSEVDQLTQNLNSHFNQTMLDSSVIVRDNIHLTRPSTKTSSNTLQVQQQNSEYYKNSSIQQNKEVLDDLDQFDRLFKVGSKRVGFPNQYLTQMKAQKPELFATQQG